MEDDLALSPINQNMKTGGSQRGQQTEFQAINTIKYRMLT